MNHVTWLKSGVEASPVRSLRAIIIDYDFIHLKRHTKFSNHLLIGVSLWWDFMYQKWNGIMNALTLLKMVSSFWSWFLEFDPDLTFFWPIFSKNLAFGAQQTFGARNWKENASNMLQISYRCVGRIFRESIQRRNWREENFRTGLKNFQTKRTI